MLKSTYVALPAYACLVVLLLFSITNHTQCVFGVILLVNNNIVCVFMDDFANRRGKTELPIPYKVAEILFLSAYV